MGHKPAKLRLPTIVGLALVLTPLVSLQPASAAVRRCGDFIATAGEDRGSEAAARTIAMSKWIEAANKVGPAFGAWRNALDKSFSCLKLPDGTHRCQALARPCGIAQNPNVLPPGALPVVPKTPKQEQRI